ncbi:MAG: hypothetical protein E6I80_26275 [Chloroflexi bacterium]|nr:MAG: hypothetical protein E6I80_26275 [Chloroflexota bacterium]
MAEKSKQGTEEKRGSSSANQERETADQLQGAATTMAAAGVLDAAGGAEQLQAASDVATASRVMLAEGASDATRGIDAANAARLAGTLAFEAVFRPVFAQEKKLSEKNEKLREKSWLCARQNGYT